MINYSLKIATMLLISLLSGNCFAILIDPTKPPNFNLATETFSTPNFALTAIIIGPNKRIAVINDKIHRIGDTIEGNKILSIDRSSVLLEGPGGQTILTLQSVLNPVKKNSIKTRAIRIK